MGLKTALSLLRNPHKVEKVLRKGVDIIKNITATPHKTSAQNLIKTNEKSLKKVIDRGGYDIQKPEIRSFLLKHRKDTTKKILKTNKPK